MSDNEKQKNKGKTLARLAAVQALYRASFGEQTLVEIVADTIDSGFAQLVEEDVSPVGEMMPDAALFAAIANGVVLNEGDLDGMLSGMLDARFSLPRMEVLLRSILRAGVFELLHNPEAPKGAVINDYVNIARAFFQGKEPGLVNAVLDKLGAKLRDNA